MRIRIVTTHPKGSFIAEVPTDARDMHARGTKVPDANSDRGLVAEPEVLVVFPLGLAGGRQAVDRHADKWGRLAIAIEPSGDAFQAR